MREFTIKNAAPQDRDNRFVRACTVEMHMDISHEPFHARISRKNAGEQMEHPDLTPALTPTVRTPQCGHAVWGTINAYDHIFNQ